MVDLKKLAIATAATTAFLLATTAKANIVDFLLVQDLSSLTAGVTLMGPAVGGTQSTIPQAVGADTTTYFGHLYVDFQAGTIQLMPGSSISAAVNGVWAPHDPVSSNPVGPPPAGADPGNYGLALPEIQLFANQYNLVLDNGAPGSGLPSTPVAIDGGGNFALAGQAMRFTAGRQAFVTALGNSTANVIDFPTIFSSNGDDVGIWNVGTQTLTIPVHSKVTFNVTPDFGGIDESYFLTGQLVAKPVVPEPSSIILAALGLIGFAAWGWRKRYTIVSG